MQAKDPETGEAQPPCIFLLTDAALSNAVLRQIGKHICTELSCAVFLFANGKAEMSIVKPLFARDNGDNIPVLDFRKLCL